MSQTPKLAAIFAADVVAFSRLTVADEDRALARLLPCRSDLIDPTISAPHNCEKYSAERSNTKFCARRSDCQGVTLPPSPVNALALRWLLQPPRLVRRLLPGQRAPRDLAIVGPPELKQSVKVAALDGGGRHARCSNYCGAPRKKARDGRFGPGLGKG
jgi:hypothetical protein